MPRLSHGRLLDTELLVSRRLELGITQRELGRVTRLNYQIIRRMEAGDGHQERTLGDLANIGKAIGLELHEMLLKRSDASASDTPDATRVLAALLAAAPPSRRVRPGELAQGLRWPVQRVLDALAEAGERLGGTGAALARSATGIRLIPQAGVLSRPDMQRLAETRLPHRRWLRENARLLGMVSRGEIGPAFMERDIGAKAMNALGQLTTLGYIRKRSDGGYELTPETAFSLGLIDSVPIGSRPSPR
jgi:transcriptional regulator with XRE-family HTH domain